MIFIVFSECLQLPYNRHHCFYCKFEEEKNPLTSSIAIIDAAVIVVRGCLLPLIVGRCFYFVGGVVFIPSPTKLRRDIHVVTLPSVRPSVLP
jgi:hypothetical protein